MSLSSTGSGYCFGIRSERRLCDEVHFNLAYRWFCRLGLDGAVPDHSTFSKNRHGRFCDSDLLREVAVTAAAYVPHSFDPGEAYQFDWSHEVVILDGVTTTVKVAHMRMCHSRMFFVRAYHLRSITVDSWRHHPLFRNVRSLYAY